MNTMKCKHGLTQPHVDPDDPTLQCVPGLRASFDRERWEADNMSTPMSITEAEAQHEEAVAKPPPTFPFTHRDRYEVAYTLLAWELLKIVNTPSLFISRDEILKALTKAAGELT